MADDFDTAFPTLTDADLAVLDRWGRDARSPPVTTCSARVT